MLRNFTRVGLVALLTLGSPPHTGHSARAQTELPRATSPKGTHDEASTHPVVGAWRWDTDLAHPNTHVSYGVFHADGTYEEVTTGAGTAVGIWQATGERTVVVTYVFQDLSEDPSVVEPGASTIRLTAEVKPSGNVIAARFTYDSRTLGGRILNQGGPDAALGSRVAAASQEPLGLATGLWSVALPGQPPMHK